ncbi:phytol kinase 1, chloroplastic isoform X2 [Mercurialis annua]|uniref:phytol kinase 1, chloroplastic isoform X2 n=1 Tax=Mercurialis annua TaxID=3986 RepID=UPI00215E472F|nr:phytol kinase 1, chloroplastic isoform X2 [Mercurialis annua]
MNSFPFHLTATPIPTLSHRHLHISHQILRRRQYALTTPRCFSTAAAMTAGSTTFLQDAGATAAVLTGAYGLVLTFDTLTQRNIIHQNSNSPEARYFASIVPLINGSRLVIHGLSLATDEGLIKSVTREGNPEELLKGPLYYVIVLIVCSLVFWRESPVGLISLAMMCGGDGVADIMGRKFGSMKLPYNQNKSWVGSISMFISGFLISIGMLYYYSALGYFELEWISTVLRVAWVALVSTLVESLPTTETVDDNISVPLTSMLAASLCFGF